MLKYQHWKKIIELSIDPSPEYYTNKDVFENDGAYAEDDKD